jgi:hypothetical protein
MTDDSSKKLEKLQRRMLRQKMHRIWQAAQSGKLDDLDEEENRIADIMLEHEEYSDDFSNADSLADYEYNPDTEVNPFLHISMHSMIGNQLREQGRNEVSKFYDAMKEKGCSHHQIIHLIGLILLPLLYEVLKYKRLFDGERYERLLNKYKHTKPEKLPALLEREFDIKQRHDLH